MKVTTETLARASSRHPWRTIALWLVLIVAMALVSGELLGGVLTDDITFTNNPESLQAQKLLDTRFTSATSGAVDGAVSSEATEFVIFTSAGSSNDDPSYAETVQALKADIERLGNTIVAAPLSTYVDAGRQADQLFTADGHGVLVAVQLTGENGGAMDALKREVPAAAPGGFSAEALTLLEFIAQGGGEGAEPQPDPPEAIVIVTSPSTDIADPAFANAVAAVEKAIREGAGPALASPPISGFEARRQAAGLVSADAHSTLIPIPIVEISSATAQALRGVATAYSSGDHEVLVAGQSELFDDFTTIGEEDLRSAERVGLGIALVVLIIVFASLVAALVPIVMGFFAIVVALGLVALIGQIYEFNLFIENMVTMIGLAVGIDYSLFIVSRYREERKKGRDRLEAIGRSGATANRAVFFSGITVVLALLGMLIIPTSIFRSLASGAILVTLISIAASMTLLPAVLALLGDRINWPTLSRRARLETSHDPKGGVWDRITRRVMARPILFLIGSVLLLGSLGAFALQLDKGTSQNVTELPDAFESKLAFIMLQEKFGAGGLTEPAKIVITDAKTPGVAEALQKLRDAIGSSPAFSPETTVTPSPDGETLLVSAYFRGDPASDEAFRGIRELRADIIPAAFSGVDGAAAYVGGTTAFFTDFLGVADHYQWIVLPFVLLLSFLLLTVVFRSIVVPVKAIIMNLLSVAAAYGAVTLVFQRGVGISVFNAIGFNFARVEAIEAWLPLFLFSVLFGLSMDYHVFLLTRIREEYDKTRDNTEAVAYGLRTTAGVITGAAAVMVAVFTGFASGRLGAFQQMGFGLAVAVFLDATVVRTVLVPASMRLLGDLNWYLPSWLQWLPELHVEGYEEVPAEASG